MLHTANQMCVSAHSTHAAPAYGRELTRAFRAPLDVLQRGAEDAGDVPVFREVFDALVGYSYLEVLDADMRLFDAELGLTQAQLGELSALVEIYRTLGGGWQT